MTVLIAVEGIDGAGKTTFIENLKTRFKEEKQCSVYVQPFPTMNTRYGLQARKELAKSDPNYQRIDLLCEADRAAWVRAYLVPVLYDRFDIIIYDRFSSSGIAYAYANSNSNSPFYEFVDSKLEIENAKPEIFKPNFTIFIDTPPEEALRRAIERGKVNDEADLDIRKQMRAYEVFNSLKDTSWFTEKEINNQFDTIEWKSQ